MGQMQNKNEGPEPKNGKSHISQPIKDRANANFVIEAGMMNNPKATGMGKSGNPGRPV